MVRINDGNALFFCDSCFVEKVGSRKEDPDSLETHIYRKPFMCMKKDAWLKHIKTPKHIKNVVIYNNTKDEYVSECKHCKIRMDSRSYYIHKERNQLLWCMKATNPIYKDCSCNNFISHNRRFNNIESVRDYSNMYENYSYGNNNINYTKKNYDKAIELMKNKEDHEVKLMEAGKRRDMEMMEKYKEKKAKEEEAKKKLKEKKNKTKIIGSLEDEEFIHKEIQMDIVEHVEEEEETPMEKKKRERNDLCIPPIFSDEDMCSNCGLYQNYLVEYEDEKLKRYNITICSCGESDVTDSD